VTKVAQTEVASDRPAGARAGQDRTVAAEAFSTAVATCRRRKESVSARVRDLGHGKEKP
jgi:hypothetical protein